MPKERRKPPRGGTSQYVRQTELSNPFAPFDTTATLSSHKPAVHSLKPTVTVLGPMARRREIQAADERIKHHLLSTSSRCRSELY